MYYYMTMETKGEMGRSFMDISEMLQNWLSALTLPGWREHAAFLVRWKSIPSLPRFNREPWVVCSLYTDKTAKVF
jgi:hypothetical protein